VVEPLQKAKMSPIMPGDNSERTASARGSVPANAG
jgi:hypothetical protein